jgi:hypothetical protein
VRGCRAARDVLGGAARGGRSAAGVPDAEVERALALGARLVARKRSQIGPIDEGWTVLRGVETIVTRTLMADPDARRELVEAVLACAR